MSTTIVEAIRSMIILGELRPRQHIRQDELADQLNVSKIPLREALRSLVGERVIEHIPRRGFFVTDLSVDSLRQLYRMRELLESGVLESVPRPAPAVIRDLRDLNREIGRADGTDDVGLVVDLNRRFHFAIFDLSPLDLMVEEVKRLWAMSEQYRAVYLWSEPARRRVHQEHQGIIKALAAGDTTALLRLSNEHRSAAANAISRSTTRPSRGAAALAGSRGRD